jgi:TPR repeat protein
LNIFFSIASILMCNACIIHAANMNLDTRKILNKTSISKTVNKHIEKTNWECMAKTLVLHDWLRDQKSAPASPPNLQLELFYLNINMVTKVARASKELSSWIRPGSSENDPALLFGVKFRDLESKLNSLPLPQKKHFTAEYLEGIVYLEKRQIEKNKNTTYEGHWVNFYIYNHASKRKILIIDGDEPYIEDLAAYYALYEKDFHSTVYLWFFGIETAEFSKNYNRDLFASSIEPTTAHDTTKGEEESSSELNEPPTASPVAVVNTNEKNVSEERLQSSKNIGAVDNPTRKNSRPAKRPRRGSRNKGEPHSKKRQRIHKEDFHPSDSEQSPDKTHDKTSEKDPCLASFHENQESDPENIALTLKIQGSLEDAQNQYSIGLCYLNGHGVIKSDSKALVWLKKAALNNHSDAIVKLAEIHFAGIGGRISFTEVFYWYEKIHMLSGGNYADKMALFYINGIGTPPNVSKACALIKNAALVGDIQTVAKLESVVADKHRYVDVDTLILYGDMNFSGKFGPTNLMKANYWYKIAANCGSDEALRKLNMSLGF